MKRHFSILVSFTMSLTNLQAGNASLIPDLVILNASVHTMDQAQPTAEAVAKGECERGIVLGGSGNGEAMVANRVKGVRCALCWNVESARLGRQHNNANVISLGERMVSPELALEIVKVWLDTPFEGGRHQRRIDLIDA